MTWAQIDDVAVISIHALREESDHENVLPRIEWCISIHALREESDSTCTLTRFRCVYFNPRSP